MNHYLIDGNNLLGKLSIKDKSYRAENAGSRELLLIRLTDHFRTKNDSVTLFFDGHENGKLSGGKIKIIYSNSRTADSLIREKIEKTKNRKALKVISSDHEIQNFARVCSCEIISSEDFAKRLFAKNSNPDDSDIKHDTSVDKDYFIKLFTSGNDEPQSL